MSPKPRQSNTAETSESANGEFADLVAEITDRLQAGEQVDMEQYIAHKPEWAERLRELLPALEVMAGLGQSSHGASGALAGGALADDVTTRSNTGAAGAHGMLGDFRIAREVGRGGMGIVYEAEQVSLGRRVALKILPFAATMDPRHLQRFHNEARSAASLHHEHIVPVYAVGQDRGVHYYAMQFIEGQTLAQVMGQQGGAVAPQPATAASTPLPPTRVESEGHTASASFAVETAPIAAETTSAAPRDKAFFRRVAEWGIEAADALEHAHQLGIVHRDVKPGNIMIDGLGKLWITDFGLARVGADSGLTMTGDLLGTLRYMSPEQALAKRVIIDHRTDIYSLGATLYELLTGQPAVAGVTREEILRNIIFSEPKPARHLNRSIPPDLETIILKAMAHEPERRYGTAKELADDLARFLKDEPVRARRPSLVQKARKWSRRHPSVMASTVATLLFAIVALAVSNLLIAQEKAEKEFALQRAEEEAAIAKAISNFFNDDVLGMGWRYGRDKNVTLAHVLGRAAAQINGKFDKQPRVEAAIRVTIGKTYLRLGDLAAAQPHLERAFELFCRVLGEKHPDTINSMNQLADLCLERGNYPQAKELFFKAVEIGPGAIGEDHPHMLESVLGLATVYMRQGHYAEAEPLYVKALELHRRVLTEEHTLTLNCMSYLAVLYVEQHQYSKGEALQLECLKARTRRQGEEHIDCFFSMQKLAVVYTKQGRYAEAEPLAAKAVDAMHRVLGEEHPASLNAINTQANLYLKKRQPAQAETILVKALELSRVHGDENPLTTKLMNSLAATYIDQREFAKAEHLLVKALEVDRRVLGEDHPGTLNVINNLGRAYGGMRQYAKAQDLLIKALEATRKKQGEEHVDTLMLMDTLGNLYLRQSDYAKAEPLLVKALEGRRRVLGQRHPDTLASMTGLASAYYEQKKYQALEQLVELYEERDQPDKAAAWRQKLDEARLLADVEKISLETSLKGKLTVKESEQAHEMKTRAGHTYVIDMKSSDLDTYLKLLDSSGKLIAENDDITPYNQNSRIIFTSKEDGVYRIVATTFEQRGQGDYTLTVKSFAKKEK